MQFWFTFILYFHFVTTCHSLRTLYVQFFYCHTWGNCYLKFLLLIYMRIAYFLNLYATRSWYFVCAGYLAEIAYLVLTPFPYNYNSAIQRGCQLLLKMYITDFYAYCIFVESLRYKVFIFCSCESFGGNRLLILTHFSYNINSDIQGGCQLLLKRYITYFIFIAYLLHLYAKRSWYSIYAGHLAEIAHWLLIWTTLPYNSNSAIQGGWKINLFIHVTSFNIKPIDIYK